MISIRKSLSELEKLSQMQAVMASCYATSIGAVGEFAVEVDPAQITQFRHNLDAVQQAVESASEPADYEAAQASLRVELRDYRDKAQKWMARMNAEMQAAAEAMQILTEGVSTNGNDYKHQLQVTLQTLRTAGEGEDVARIRTAIANAIIAIEQCCDQALQENQLMIAQFNDEIRSLHREMDKERKLLYTDRASGAWNRKKIENRIEDLLDRGEAFCVVVVWLNHGKRLEESALKETVARANGILGRDAMFGRWNDDEFAVVVEANAATAIAIAAELSRAMIQITTVVVEHSQGSGPEKFRHKLKQASHAVRRATH